MPISRLLLKLFWEVRLAGMTDHLKEVRLRGSRWVHALRERERKHLHRGKKECYGGLPNETNLPSPGKGEWHTDEPFGGR